MGSDRYHWVAHQDAVQRLVALASRDRKAILNRIRELVEAPHLIQSEKSFSLPDQAPYFVLTVGKHVLTLQLDHAVKELRLLAVE